MPKILVKLAVPVGLAFIGLVGLLFNYSSLPIRARENFNPPMLDRPGQSGVLAIPENITITVEEVVATDLTLPVQVTHAGDGSGRLFVVEQPGQIRVVKDGSTLATPFLDIRGLVEDTGSEQGLLGLAFHPDYETNGHFYVYYNREDDGAIVVARYFTPSGTPDVADPASATILLTIPHPNFRNHNGGQLMFSPVDGYLYIGTGDGGSGGDPNNNAQSKNSLLGKLLRLDVNNVVTYTVPPDNPYVGVAGDDRLWAIGLRNPWRFSFDRANGDLYIGDVGQDDWEEVDYQAAGTPGGVNFGWRCREGAHNFNFSGECGAATLTDPIAEYPNGSDIAVTGGFVYRGNLYPALVGRYFYADYGSGKIWSLYKTGSNPDSWSTPELELNADFSISAFGEDEQGELYVVEYQDNGNGQIRRLADVNGSSPNLSTSTKQASSLGAEPGQVLTYTILIKNTGLLTTETVFLSDQVPPGLTYVPGSLAATHGNVDDTFSPLLRWQGLLTPVKDITMTYRVTATGLVTGPLTNQAVLTGLSIESMSLSFTVFVPRPFSSYLPVIIK